MKKKKYPILRNRVTKRALGNLGKVEILDNKIVCYVKGKKIMTRFPGMHRYKLIFNCAPINNEKYRKYDIDKPIHYIVEDIYFDREIDIIAPKENCHITFENCTFTAAIEISSADHITFTNNIYKAQPDRNYLSIYKEGEFCISTRKQFCDVNNLEFINDKLVMEDIELITVCHIKDVDKIPKTIKKKCNIELYLNAKEVSIINTDILNVDSIQISAETLDIESSNINSKEIEISSDTILNCSNIKTKVISIEAGVIEGPTHIESNGIFVNGVQMNKNEKNIQMGEMKEQKKVLELINTLKKIERASEETLMNELRKEPLTRVLRK